MGCFVLPSLSKTLSKGFAGGLKQPISGPIGAVACCSLLLLTCAILMTSSRPKAWQRLGG